MNKIMWRWPKVTSITILLLSLSRPSYGTLRQASRTTQNTPDKAAFFLIWFKMNKVMWRWPKVTSIPILLLSLSRPSYRTLSHASRTTQYTLDIATLLLAWF